MKEIVRKRLNCRGWVQGVGFRWRARHAAGLYGVTGWVRNEDDGSVTLELQGEAAAIDRVMEAIARGTYVRIESMEVRGIDIDPLERGFRVK